MHHKLTKDGRYCINNNQLPTKSHIVLEDNYVVWPRFVPLQSETICDLLVSLQRDTLDEDHQGSKCLQCRIALKPDGLFLATMFGGETLRLLWALLHEGFSAHMKSFLCSIRAHMQH